ncbi:MAG TPA: MFS transporter [Ktedonobacteraceae bacterium]|jgi:MFS family permease|nr:MFS transporter [Ktedonobacteraceae bacterium]
MYTLEDDQETSSRLRKRDFQNTSYIPAAPRDGSTPATPEEKIPGSMPAASENGSMFAVPEEKDPGSADGTNAASEPPPESGSLRTSSFTRLFSPQQITSSFKQLGTPGKNAAGSGNKRTALLAMIVACVAVFFTAMDQTVVVTVLPKIIADPGINISFTHLDHAAWIVSAYLLGFIIAMPLMGRVSDIYGRRRILLLCLSIFAVGSVLCALAPVFGQNIDLSFLSFTGIDTSSPGLIFLIAARFFQAIGGGAVVPVAMAIVSDFYGQERRGLALGIIGAVTEAGGVVGPLYGALIVQKLDWTYIFYFNVPIVLVLAVLTWFVIPRGKRLNDGIDWIGALLLGAALTCISLGLAQQGTDLGPTTVNGSGPQNNPISLALAVIFLIAFIVVEKKVRHPVVDLSVFKRFSFSASSLVSLLVGAALIIAMADIPLFVDTVLSKQIPQDQLSLVSGLALLRLTAMIPIGAFLGGWLCGRLSCRLTGVIGLLFTAVGFYLMSRWPMNVDWNQITVSTVTTGLGFGLVIAPISTTAINSVRPTQAGMGSAIVTSLRMTGMIFGLAALTSWALAYFKQLASQFPSLPTTATAAQFAKWSTDYANHLIASAHAVYSAVFFLTMFVCLIAIVPAIFLWGNKPALEEDVQPEDSSDNVQVFALSVASPDDETAVVTPALTGTFLASAELLDEVSVDVQPPVPPVVPDNNGGGSPPRRRKRKRLLLLAAALLLLVLVVGGVFAVLSSQSPDDSGSTSANGASGAGSTPTATPIAGPRMIELALDNGALTSIFTQQLGMNQGTLTDMKVAPQPGDGVVISLNLHIDSQGIHRVMPVELDTTIGVDKQQNIQLHVLHLKRDGLDAGPTAAARMEHALNQLLISSLMPSLHSQLKGAKLISVHTSSTIVCGAGTEMLVLLIQAPPIQGIAAQPTPTALCFKGPIDINKLMPS